MFFILTLFFSFDFISIFFFFYFAFIYFASFVVCFPFGSWILAQYHESTMRDLCAMCISWLNGRQIMCARANNVRTSCMRLVCTWVSETTKWSEYSIFRLMLYTCWTTQVEYATSNERCAVNNKPNKQTNLLSSRVVLCSWCWFFLFVLSLSLSLFWTVPRFPLLLVYSHTYISMVCRLFVEIASLNAHFPLFLFLFSIFLFLFSFRSIKFSLWRSKKTIRLKWTFIALTFRAYDRKNTASRKKH